MKDDKTQAWLKRKVPSNELERKDKLKESLQRDEKETSHERLEEEKKELKKTSTKK